MSYLSTRVGVVSQNFTSLMCDYMQVGCSSGIVSGENGVKDSNSIFVCRLQTTKEGCIL